MLSDRTLFEQGCFRFDKRVFVLNLFYRKIVSNIENIEVLLAEKNSKYKDFDRDGQEKLVVPKTYHLMAKKRQKEFRLQSRPCDIVSSHPLVEEQDSQVEKRIKDHNFILDV